MSSWKWLKENYHQVSLPVVIYVGAVSLVTLIKSWLSESQYDVLIKEMDESLPAGSVFFLPFVVVVMERTAKFHAL